MILGHPCLNDLGFASTKYSIELRTYGIEFPAIVPDEHKESPQGERVLRINSHYNVQPVGSTWTVQTVWCQPDKVMCKGGLDDVGVASSLTSSDNSIWIQGRS